MAHRTYPSSQYRGPLVASNRAGPAAGAPAQVLNQLYGRQKIVHNAFTTALDLARLVQVDIGGAVGTPTISSITGAYQGIPAARFFIGQTINQGTHWYQGVSSAGLGQSLAGSTARDYDPELVVSFVTELSFPTAACVNNATWAIGLGNADGNVTLAAADGAVDAAADGFFFRIPRGAAGTSGAIQCVWVQLGNLEIVTTTTRTFTVSTTNPPALRLGIRLALHELSAANPPIISDPTRIEYWINDVMVAQHDFANANTGALPLSIAPSVTGVDLVGGTDCMMVVPYWTYSIGPVRSGATIT